jgi:glycosyltransferase involved in cell wall biosynthesis
MEGFSIIICTHNPNEFVFKKLLYAIEKLDIYKIKHEIIIVDNNSRIPIGDRQFVIDFVKRKGNVEILVEPKSGLTTARIAGINVAHYDWLIFFDDDNEPNFDYLSKTHSIISLNNELGALGPGIVSVIFPNKQFDDRFSGIRSYFQERNEFQGKFSNNKIWQDNYPAGTGLIIRKDICLKYSDCVITGIYDLSDRKGNSLSSGGDLQMVLSAVKYGYNVGVHPDLILKHNITKDKLKFGYLIKLAFGTSSANAPGHLQVWQGLVAEKFSAPMPIDIIKQFYFHLKVKWHLEGFMKTMLSFSGYLGDLSGIYQVNPNIKPSVIWRIFCFFLRVK